MSKFEICSWNVNSIRARREALQRYLQERRPDVLALQEIKQHHHEIEAEGYGDYRLYAWGQKTYNGVAFLSREPLTAIVENIPGLEDAQARCLSASWGDIRIMNVYVPNGRELNHEHYHYKLAWLDALQAYLAAELKRFPKLIVLGDFNITPAPLDSCLPADSAAVFHSPAERARLQALDDLGLRDSFRERHPQRRQFSWWDYRLQSFRRDWGLRIDLIYASEALSLLNADVDVAPRRWERPSDHAPVWAQFAR